MKYQSSSALTKKYRAQRIRFAMLCGGVLFVLALVAFLIWGGIALFGGKDEPSDSSELMEYAATSPKLERVRLCRSEIPAPDFAEYPCHKMFADSNDVQLESAMANGLSHPDMVDDLDGSMELVRLTPTKLYALDTMTHSKPYLVPDAALMLWYIGERFQEVLKEENHDGNEYKIIVTSALRSNQDVARLRRSNGNASENSCHRYGTTIDITYSKFLRGDGELVNEEWLKMTLAKALYELRYEGICYVKYEYRQPCFHITLRNAEYVGDKTSEKRDYPDFKYQMLESKVTMKPKVFGGQ